ncbi:MAG: helix-turn-helix domain-containing protein [Ruminococcus sp.]|nr:helix-turn-helix domain-containing protein [Ruminococcus sp.]
MGTQSSLVPAYVNSFTLFISALDYIEANLCSEFSQENIAEACYCSLSSLQKTWKFCTHMSLKEYINKRRVTLAGVELSQSDISVLDAALKYGFNSHEVFTRAFTKVWGVSPSRFRKEWKGSCNLYPKLNPMYFEGTQLRNVKKYEIGELYDYLRSQTGKYVLCFDVKRLDPINKNLGRIAGDKVIIEAFRRINEAAGEDMLCLRLGGDEFAMVTGTDNKTVINEITEKILAQNGCRTPYPGGEVEVAVRCGAIMIGEGLKYSVLCDDFERVMDRARETGQVELIIQEDKAEEV